MDPQETGERNSGETMALSDLLGLGYRFYRRRDPDRADCEQMRPLENHLGHLSELVLEHTPDQSSAGFISDEVEHEWGRVAQWLRLAAGLEHVYVDTAYGEFSSDMCGTAADYHDAANDIASRWATEHTRLQYVWNAGERLLASLKLPLVPDAPGRFNGATALLDAKWRERPLPTHYNCVVGHLRRHVEVDSELSDNPRLSRAFDVTPWRGQSGILLAAGNQLRHPTAHGDLNVPEPVTWERGDAGGQDVQRTVHAPRLAARGLALSIQMLLLSAEGSYLDEATPALFENWWVQTAEGKWERRAEASPHDLFTQAHLKPPDDDDDVDSEEGYPPHAGAAVGGRRDPLQR